MNLNLNQQTRSLKAQFDQVLTGFEGRPGPVLELKKKAWEDFSNSSWPTKNKEAWKYTNIKPLLKHTYDFDPKAPNKSEVNLVREKLKDINIKNALKIVLINGKFNEELSDLTQAQNYFVIDASNGTGPNDNRAFEPASEVLNEDQNCFELMNLAFFTQSLSISTKKNNEVEKPLVIVNVSTGGEAPLGSFVNISLTCAPGSKLTLAHIFMSIGEGVSFNNVVSNFYLNENSSLNYLKFQNEGQNSFHVSTENVHVKAKAVYEGLNVDLGGSLVRNELNVNLLGPQAHAQLGGLYLASNTQHIDNHTLIHHNSGQTTSAQLYKGVLTDSSHSVFNGKVKISEGSQQVNSSQYNKNLLLSSKAEIDSKPELEVSADDVSAAHGSAIGALDEEQIFYLETRGINREQAIKILLRGYVDEVVFDFSPQTLKSFISHQLTQTLTEQF